MTAMTVPRGSSRGPRAALVAWEEEHQQRVCKKCDETKPLDEYHREKHGRLGRAYACKACVCEIKRVAMAARRKADPDSHREAVRRQQQRDDWNERRRAAYLRQRDRVQAENSRARARRASAEGNFTVDEWLALCELYCDKCLCCGQETVLEPDHVIPLSLGGTNDIGNIQPLCRPCNARKGNRHATDYRENSCSSAP